MDYIFNRQDISDSLMEEMFLDYSRITIIYLSTYDFGSASVDGVGSAAALFSLVEGSGSLEGSLNIKIF